MNMKEIGEPAVLLENPKSMFYSLVEQTGPIVASHLREMAKQVISHLKAMLIWINVLSHRYQLQASESRRSKILATVSPKKGISGNPIHLGLCPKASQEQGLDESEFELIESCKL